MTARKRGGAAMVQTGSGSVVMANPNGVAPDEAFRAHEQRRAEAYDALLRRLRELQGFPNSCGDRACRRAQACVGRGLRCQRDQPPLPPPTPEDRAKEEAAMEMFREALRREAHRRGLWCAGGLPRSAR